jgi:hypothetical protein
MIARVKRTRSENLGAEDLAKDPRRLAPGRLAFEEPTRYPFVINLKTAKATGIELPQDFVALAERGRSCRPSSTR